jgi:beta-galactosidase GanA
VYDFEDQNDIIRFIELAHKRDLYVILRPGPYACAEHDYGGMPWWLMSNGTEFVRPRTSESIYMSAVRRWLHVLLPKFVLYLYKNGGPILSVQVYSYLLVLFINQVFQFKLI